MLLSLQVFLVLQVVLSLLVLLVHFVLPAAWLSCLPSYSLPSLFLVDQVPDSWLQRVAGYELYVLRADLLVDDDVQSEGLNAADEVGGGVACDMVGLGFLLQDLPQT